MSDLVEKIHLVPKMSKESSKLSNQPTSWAVLRNPYCFSDSDFGKGSVSAKRE
jgi:hypothetical protein